MTDPLLLPEGCRLIHIGPHKTGTTAVQWALHSARESLHEQGVHYAGSRPQAYLPAIALTGRAGRIGGPRVDDTPWRELVAEISDQGDRRVVVSSESFAKATADDVKQLAEDLGPDRVHIVRMLRRYDKMLPSQWQQNVAGGGRKAFSTYLDEIQVDQDHPFWLRHGFANLTRIWSDVVGPENVSTVVVDETDRDWLLRVFERFVGLNEGTLRAPQERANRSLTRGEVELLRRFNWIHDEQGWVDRVHFQYIRLAASPAMRHMPPDPAGGRITVPAELYPLLAEATERDLATLRDLGVRIVGDTGLLEPKAPTGDPGSTGAATDPTVSVAGAAAAVVGVITRAETHTRFPLFQEGPSDADTEEDAEGDSGEDPADRHHVGPDTSDDAEEGPGPATRPEARVPALRRGTEIAVVPPTGPEGARLRSVLALSTELAAAKHGCQVLDRVEDLRGRRTHVVVVAVPPRQLLALRWNEHVLERGEASYEAWQPGHLTPDSFDGRLRAAVKKVGAKRVTVVLDNAYEPDTTLRTLAELAGIDGEALEGRARPRAQLSWSEASLLRRIDADLRADGREQSVWDRYVRDGVVPWLLSQPPTLTGRVHPLDEAAAAWVRAQTQAVLDALQDTGVRVVGNLARFKRGAQAEPDVVPGAAAPEPRVRPVTGALAVSGAVAATDPTG